MCIKNFLVRCFLLLCLVLLPPLVPNIRADAPGFAGDNTDADWPYQLSDLKPDPSIIRGVLANGFRYIIKENHEPKNRVAAYLAVLSGSMEETDAEQGVAHFLEHLMFNGTTNFPPGTLVDYFQSIGMDFGGDINASTGFEKTVYHLILPNNKEDDLAVACKLLADYAQGALLLESEIDKERGVILSEKRTRDSSSYRNHVAYTEFALKGTRYPLRFPIGKEFVLQTADRRLLKEYYDSWYRPDNMVLVLVGDVEPEVARRTVTTYFSGLKTTLNPPEDPEFGSLEHTGLNVFYRYDPELGKTNVSIETLWDVTPKTPLKVDEKDELIQLIGKLIVGYRLQRQEEKQAQPYVAARYSSGRLARQVGYGSIYGVTDEASWEKTLESLHSTIETIRIHGVSQEELTRARDEILAELTKDVQTASSMNSRIIAERIIDHLLDGDVYMSPLQEKELYTPMLGEIGVEDVNRGFKKIWDNKNRLVSVTGDLELGGGGEKEIKDLYETLTEAETREIKEQKEVVFPYLEPVPGVIGAYEKTLFPELGMTRYILAGGLILNLKKTDFEKNKIRISAHFGRGEQEEERAGMAFIADDVINFSGTNKLSLSDLNTLLAGSSVDLSFRIGRLSSSWSGSALSDDVTPLIQVLQTMLLDAGFENVAFDKVMRRLELMYKRLDSEIRGAVIREVQPFLAGNNAHYGLPSWEHLSEISFSETREWVKNLLDLTDLEISVVGDFDEDSVVGLFNRYLGGLQLQKAPARVLDENIVFPEGKSIEVDVPSKIEKSTVLLTWPTDDFWNIGKTRRLSVLATVLEDRIRKVVREKLGASYAPRVSSYGSRIHEGYGFIQVEVDVEGQRAEYLADQIKTIVRQLSLGGITDEELSRAKKPLITSVLENIETNQYWLYSVLSLSSSHPGQLVWPTTIVDDINSITPKELTLLAGKYLQNTKVAEAVVRAGNNKVADTAN